jgi:hypothetical protein
MTRTGFFVACVGIFCLDAGTRPQLTPSRSRVVDHPGAAKLVPGRSDCHLRHPWILDRRTRRHRRRQVRSPQPASRACRGRTSVGANLGTFSITGTATLDGETYHRINALTSSNFVHLHLIGTNGVAAGDRLVAGDSRTVHGSGRFIVYLRGHTRFGHRASRIGHGGSRGTRYGVGEFFCQPVGTSVGVQSDALRLRRDTRAVDAGPGGWRARRNTVAGQKAPLK